MENHNLEYKDLLNAGVHFGHLTRKWNPKMSSYIFMERNGIHIIDLNKTLVYLDQACGIAKNIARSGRRIMFVATKKQAREVVSQEADRLRMPHVTDRWLGGMLTNFVTIRKSLKKMQSIDKKMRDQSYENLTKKERLMLTREREKLFRILGGIVDMHKIPAALFVVDVKREHIAIKEAKRLGIPVIGIVDTNVDPDPIDHPIPGNDDAFKSITAITHAIGRAIEEGLHERKQEKEHSKIEEVAQAEAIGDEDAIANASGASDEVATPKSIATNDEANAETVDADANHEDDTNE